jgi:mannose-1-phosphate guanylyltransferase
MRSAASLGRNFTEVVMALGKVETAMVLCAGFGTRMGALSNELPKPLMPVGDRPVVAHIGRALANAGYRRLVLNTHHLAESFDAGVLASLALPATVIHERDAIRGTAGGVRGAAAALGDEVVLIHAGDILAEVDFARLWRVHDDMGALATLAVKGGLARGQGTLGMGAGGAVVRLRGELFGDELEGADFVGVQLVSPELRRALPLVGCLVADAYLPRLRAGEPVVAAACAEAFVDVGSPTGYLSANRAWLGRRPEWLGEGAEIAPGVVLEGSLVGAGARVGGTGRLVGCVVWPHAAATAPLANTIVGTGASLKV